MNIFSILGGNAENDALYGSCKKANNYKITQRHLLLTP